MTILLLGANGQVGFELQRVLPRLGPVAAYDVPAIDFSRPESLRALVRSVAPDIIVNAAAYTAVDRAESDAETAFAVNAAAPGILAEEAQALGARLVHYSTDYVFDGTKSGFYVETDPTAPLSVYGRTKCEGERLVQACDRHLIFRTSWVVGVHGANFIKTMLRLAGDRESLRVVADQHGAPTSAALLAEMTAAVLSQTRGDDSRWGLYHLVPSGVTSWHGLARHVIERAHSLGVPLKVTADDITAITTAEYPTPAHRPANSRLGTEKLRNAFALTLPDWMACTDEVVDGIIRSEHDHNQA